MAYVTQKRNSSGGWEIRESRATPKGPRSRTLATFGVLSDEVIDRAVVRSESGLDPDSLRRAALRAGAPVEETAADRAAAELLGELDDGRAPRRALEGLLADAFGSRERISSHEARAAAAWLRASPDKRGETLIDLLLLGDALPRKRRGELRFPRLDSAPA